MPNSWTAARSSCSSSHRSAAKRPCRSRENWNATSASATGRYKASCPARNREHCHVGRRRPSRRSYANPALEALYLAREEQILEFNQQEWIVKQAIQLDWNNGYSDRRLKLTDTDSNEQLVYLTENKTFLHAFLETPIAQADISFSTEIPPEKLSWEEQDYELVYQQKGKIFSTRRSRFRWAQQWIYETADRRQYLRIINLSGRLQYYAGTLMETPPPTDHLDLDSIPQEELEFLRRGWEGRDIV